MSTELPISQTIRLPAVLDLTEAAPLAETLLCARGVDVRLDASEVTRLGGQCLQVLLAAAKTWAEDDLKFEICQASPECGAALNQFGVNSFIIEMREPHP